MDVETKGDTPDQGYGRSWAAPGEIDTFDQFVEDFHAGRINPDDFKRFRLQHGIYGQRPARSSDGPRQDPVGWVDGFPTRSPGRRCRANAPADRPRHHPAERPVSLR